MAVAASGALRVVNPATLEFVGMVASTEPSAIQELVSEAKVAQPGWGETPLADRRWFSSISCQQPSHAPRASALCCRACAGAGNTNTMRSNAAGIVMFMSTPFRARRPL